MALSARIKPKAAGSGFSIKLQSTDTPNSPDDDSDNNEMSSQPLISRRSADHAKMV